MKQQLLPSEKVSLFATDASMPFCQQMQQPLRGQHLEC